MSETQITDRSYTSETYGELPELARLVERIDLLKTKLIAAAPDYPMLLSEIHKLLSSNEALTHMLSEEQIGVIFQGLSVHKNVVLVTSTAKTKTATGKKLKDVGEDDI